MGLNWEEVKHNDIRKASGGPAQVLSEWPLLSCHECN